MAPPPLSLGEARIHHLRSNLGRIQVEPESQQLKIKSDRPVIAVCSHCKTQVVTSTSHQIGSASIVSSLVCCVFGFWPCAVVPFLSKDFKDTVHECLNCGNVVANVKRVDVLI